MSSDEHQRRREAEVLTEQARSKARVQIGGKHAVSKTQLDAEMFSSVPGRIGQMLTDMVGEARRTSGKIDWSTLRIKGEQDEAPGVLAFRARVELEDGE